MRTALLPLALVASIVGCESAATSQEVADLREQVAQLQAKLDKLPDQPIILALSSDATLNADGGPRYRLAAGTVAGQSHMEAIYVVDLSSGRMVTMMFNAGSDKLEIIAGRDLRRDLHARVPPSRLPSEAEPEAKPLLPVDIRGGGASFITVRGSPDEHVLVVVDDANQKLLIYRLDNARKRLVLVGSEDLAKLFKGSTKAAARRDPAPLAPPAPAAPTAPATPEVPPAPRPKPGPPPF